MLLRWVVLDSNMIALASVEHYRGKTIHWKQAEKSAMGIGDFIVQLPGLDFLLNDMNCKVHYYATEKFKSLLPQNPNLTIHDYHKEECNIPPSLLCKWGWDVNYAIDTCHVSALWLPALEKYKRNFYLFKEKLPFTYPSIPFQRSIYKSVIKKLGLEGKKYVTFVKMTSNVIKCWSELGWQKLINILSKEGYVCINTGLVNSSINAYVSLPNDNAIQLDGSLSLLELAHLTRGASFNVSPDTGLMHLATAIGQNKILVLYSPQNPDYRNWIYPNSERIYMTQSIDDIIDDVMEKIK